VPKRVNSEVISRNFEMPTFTQTKADTQRHRQTQTEKGSEIFVSPDAPNPFFAIVC